MKMIREGLPIEYSKLILQKGAKVYELSIESIFVYPS